MGEAYQIKDQEMPYFLTFQVVGWADVFSRKVYRDFILENLTYCRRETDQVILESTLESSLSFGDGIRSNLQNRK
jgi:hypothetical protein